MGKVIGIDLGTTNSVCAFLDQGEPKIIINEEGGRVTPSVVGFSASDERFVGDVAKRQMLINPDATIHSIKRFIGKSYKHARDDIRLVNYKVVESPSGDCGVEIRGKRYTPQEISAMILQKIRKSAEDFLGEEVTEAVITVPAYFTDGQKKATRDAGRIAGLNVLRIVTEPTAAALAYARSRKKPSTIAVYDFGGGTFDISILEVAETVSEVRASRGNNALGGADIDHVIVTWLLEQFRREHGLDVGDDRIALQRLSEAAERAKVELSNMVQTTIYLPFLVNDASGPKHLQAQLTRATLESLAEPLFQKTIDECRRALADARLDISQLDEVILVGGSSRIPRVQELVRSLFNVPLNKSFNPDEVVAIGAAIHAGILQGEIKDVVLLDVCSFSLGIEIEGRRFAPLIPRNTVIPAQKTQLVSTVVDNQRTVKIHVLQGESQDARENVHLAEFELTDIPPAPRGAPRIQVRFAINSDGLVNVSAIDLQTGRKVGVSINTPTGVQDADIQKLAGEAEERRKRDREADELKGLKHNIERQLVDLESFLRDNRGTLHKNDIYEIEQMTQRGRMALIRSASRDSLSQTSLLLARFITHLTDKLGRDSSFH